ncbi:MAG: hypothetical protein AAB571_04370 [Chloroflexota bacterium]
MSEEESVVEDEQEEREETTSDDEIEIPMPFFLEVLRACLRLLPIFVALLTAAASLLGGATLVTVAVRVAGSLFITLLVSIVLMVLSTHLVLWLLRTPQPAPAHTRTWEA